ncbi:acyl-CoA dehydrogenase [Saccharopolyspora antimicrobica]|uniref:Acyl-CoA dehydrogenase n=1 Tax=Saccharopolyspora antimicrobica TaxID=455193 RepID=A0A1I5GQN9_9PSEU|nr:acyl-CoA dehydrogenase family protein [Saccharopolyspora antimicrobica]RKT87406.1 acyl-CoA dehydrogenase [Saccharopolyspora antimicrobica]SFO38239.1 acyl-CoA dehydrogenase [Saccharopolyspora antimicrobica]
MTFTLEPDYGHLPELQGWVAKLRTYLDEELIPFEREHGITAETRVDRAALRQVWRRSRELGFYGINLPPELGGHGLSNHDLCVLKEEAAARGSSLFPNVLGDMGGPLRVGVALNVATQEQLERYFLPVIRGERACCFSLTEPQAGSDIRRMTTTARRDEGGYRLTGRKVFSSAASFADFAIVVARHHDEGETYSAFIVDFDAAGCTVLDGDTPMSGQHIEGDILLEDCFVPAANVLGPLGKGLQVGVGRINMNRLLHCPTMIGLARRALQLSLDYARNRTVSGGPMVELQAIQHHLAQMSTELHAARAMVLATAAQADRGAPIVVEANMCKLFTAEAAFRVADLAVQIHGKTGVTQGHEVEQIFRTLRMFRIVTGTTEIHKNAIAKGLVGRAATAAGTPR